MSEKDGGPAKVEMSAEPVAEVSYSSWNGMNISVLAGAKTLPAGTYLYAQSPAQARAMAIAECARVAKERTHKAFATDDAFMEGRYDAASEIEAAIRALSSPSVTEEWVEKQIKDAFWQSCGKRDDNALAKNAVRATLAALGVKVEGAAK